MEWNERLRNKHMVTLYLINELKPLNGKNIAFSTIGAGPTISQHAEECKLIHSYLLLQSSSPSGSRTSSYKQIYKTKRMESGEEHQPWGRHRENFPEEKTNGLGCKIKHPQMGPHKIA